MLIVLILSASGRPLIKIMLSAQDPFAPMSTVQI